MAFARIMEDVSSSLSHRYTTEGSDISITVCMETFNGDPTMYMTVSYPLDSFLKAEDLCQHESLIAEETIEIEDMYSMTTLNFKQSELACNTDKTVFSHTISFALNELHRLHQLNEMRKEQSQRGFV